MDFNCDSLCRRNRGCHDIVVLGFKLSHGFEIHCEDRPTIPGCHLSHATQPCLALQFESRKICLLREFSRTGGSAQSDGSTIGCFKCIQHFPFIARSTQSLKKVSSTFGDGLDMGTEIVGSCLISHINTVDLIMARQYCF